MRALLISATSLAFLAVSALLAQETRSVIFGRVTDPQNSAVTGATVVVTNTDTNSVTTLTTNDTGHYEANLLLPGNYRVAAEMPGFKRSIHSRITLPRQLSRCGNPYQVLRPTREDSESRANPPGAGESGGRAEFASCGVRTCDTAYFNMSRNLASEAEGSASRRARACSARFSAARARIGK